MGTGLGAGLGAPPKGLAPPGLGPPNGEGFGDEAAGAGLPPPGWRVRVGRKQARVHFKRVFVTSIALTARYLIQIKQVTKRIYYISICIVKAPDIIQNSPAHQT